ncbi:hypothetical protein STSP2_00152 [Anaerohalosphaera lusitana]|uniref:Uncharacterized protein n=1 Tax=Anaerohalosphaera lusitana TaxID=1936003 RepID=A0A1U9NGZ8_9BACT|nr:hypothetical protein [Anaerohalosphaera lusitana]AQT67014.1 hypothetical protein STSP2_00152 [Anaerohalosphaera lusitana]
MKGDWLKRYEPIILVFVLTYLFYVDINTRIVNWLILFYLLAELVRAVIQHKQLEKETLIRRISLSIVVIGILLFVLLRGTPS